MTWLDAFIGALSIVMVFVSCEEAWKAWRE